MTHRYRQVAVTTLVTGSMCLVTACGSSSSSSKASSSSPGAARRAAVNLTATQKSCLKSHGVSLTFGVGGQGPNRGSPPSNGQRPPKGVKPPKGGFRNFRGGTPSAKFQKQMKARLAAFRACDVSFPSRGGSGGAPPASGA